MGARPPSERQRRRLPELAFDLDQPLLAAETAATGPEETADSAPPEVTQTAEIAPVLRAEDAAILTRLDSLLTRETPHLDPNLTLMRLARRLRLPEKRLSAAVNAATGENVSHYVNAWRIHAACAGLGRGLSVTEAMLESGFNTKSNFNREFCRAMGTIPSAWLSGRTAGASLAVP
ncbi:helix-turn-helix domain-containing protein [Pseudodonghicola flavimaris]|uniref:Helix-turn-helix domain-containing protein n=1 Tax=Pseudodonghicola flavimaris TaxID=3050036 RepID=A0ABT7F845_9RHOB|nr:helix-turn-helix domain-containing protein [Pseudodonghicola flavimaris]MDK3020784.1 helix-turn-helix domain-containing protein [Pseudodonghicola flavimaris]